MDARVIANIAALAQSASKKINVQVARDVRLSDLYADENFIFMGSPRSNLWTTLFEDQLDFRFVFDDASHQEIIRNVHPRPGRILRLRAYGERLGNGSIVCDGSALFKIPAKMDRSSFWRVRTAKARQRRVSWSRMVHDCQPRCEVRNFVRATCQAFSTLAAAEHHGRFPEQCRRPRVPRPARRFDGLERSL